MRLRRKSVDIVVTEEADRARSGADPATAAADPTVDPADAFASPAAETSTGATPQEDAATVQATDQSSSAGLLGASIPGASTFGDQIPGALDPIVPAPNGNGNVGGSGIQANGAQANGNGTNGGHTSLDDDAPVGVPFGAAVVRVEPRSSGASAALEAQRAVDAPQGGGVATMAPALTSPPATTPASAPAAAAAAPAIAPAPAPAPNAPISYAPPVEAPAVEAPAVVAPAVVAPAVEAPAVEAPVVAATPVATTPIEWSAPGWREYHQRQTAGVAPPAALAPAPPTAPHVRLAGPIATPAASPAVAPEAPAMVDDPPYASDTESHVEAAPASEAAPATEAVAPEHSKHLGEMLIARQLITREQLDHALAEQSATGLRLGAQLVALGSLTERELIGVLADQFGVRTTDLRVMDPSPDAVSQVPEDLARRLEVLPIRVTPEGLEIAGAELPSDEATAELEAAVGGPIVFVLATPTEIQRSTNQVYQALAGMEQQVRAFVDLASERTRGLDNGTKILVDERAPVVQVVTLLLTQAVRDRSSDIHIEPQDGDVRVRFRVDGVLREVTTVPRSMAAALISRIKVMADMNIVERRRSQDGQIQTTVDGRPLDVRVATTATIWGEKAVLRLLDKTRSLRALGELGMTVETSRKFSELVTSPFGMVVCAGPTGSGKTTTLYAALTEINSPERNITTIEDPVEYVLPRINQIQVNNQAGISFADGLKSIMRQDPDVILVGEIRDVETARIAVQSALTGHFVLSSIHATDGATALQRFRDMGIEPFLITSSLLAVEAQRLVRRICSHCREPYTPSVAERTFFEKATGRDKEQWFHGAGCNLCMQSGYSERVGVYELLVVSEAIQELVLNDGGHDEIQALARAEGMHSLKDEALRLIEEDITTVEEAIRSVYVR
ncbi:MAG TPA: GspE/PulE family protein [Acidimicrobiia bacterium]|nr:GspE/PulE family protein [Acidimicrobiia bacterium]